MAHKRIGSDYAAGLKKAQDRTMANFPGARKKPVSDLYQALGRVRSQVADRFSNRKSKQKDF